MANIDGGALSFKSVMENDQMNSAIEETLRRIQGLSDATVAGGKQMDKAFLQTADGIRQALGQIGAACEIHETELAKLEAQYSELGKEASAAFKAGREAEAKMIRDAQASIQGEIAVRKQALEEARSLSNQLEEEAQKMEGVREATESNVRAHQSLRSRIRELKEEMAMLIDQGIDEQSEAYKALVNELGRLQDIQGDISQQGKILANDEAKFQGIIQGISGLSGAFSAATGAVSLFAGENENLQKVMTKVQSVMAIAMGMQSIAQTLNKDSAFRLVTLNSLKEWWTGIVTKATVAETAETAAMVANATAQQAQTAATTQNTIAQGANTVATGAQTAAATAGTVANFTLAGAFRAVGLAIKSIPVFGWILAGISALIALVANFSNKAREAKKAQEEFTRAMVEGAYKPIGKIEELSAKYTALGNNIKEKEQFIKDNKKTFDELGVSVTSVRDAENLLINNKDAFVAAQIAKAKAMVYTQQATEKIKRQMELQAEYDAMPNTQTIWMGGALGGGAYVQVDNKAKQEKKKEIEALNKEIKDGYNNVIREEANALKAMHDSGVKKTKEYANGTVGAIEQAISQKQEALKDLVPNSVEWEKTNKEIEALQKRIEKPTKKTASKSDKDPFVEQLEKRKAEYERFKKWINSGDEVLVKSASSEFEELLVQGATYIDYLKRQRDIILAIDTEQRTKEQNKQLRTLNDQISDETKKTVLDAFNSELAEHLSNAKTTLEILNIISQKRKELGENVTDVDNDKKQALDDAEKNALQSQEREAQKVLDDYADITEKKRQLETAFLGDVALLNKKFSQASTEEEKERIRKSITNRRDAYRQDVANLLLELNKMRLSIIDVEREKSLQAISQKHFIWESDREKESLNARKKALNAELALYESIQRESEALDVALRIERINTEVAELNENINKLPAVKLKEILDGVSKISSELGNLGGEIGDVFKTISKSADLVKISFDDNARASDKVSAGISGIVDITNMLISSARERKRAEEELYRSQIELAHRYALALNEIILAQSEMSGGGFITDYSGKIKSGFDALAESTQKYNESLQKLANGKVKVGLRDAVNWSNVAKGAGAGAAAGAAIGSFIPVIGTAIGGVIGGIVGGIAGLFGGKKKREIYGGLLETFPELIDATGKLNEQLAKSLIATNKLDESTKQLLENALDWEEAAKKAKEQVNGIVNELAGDLGNSLKNAIVNAWKSGEDSSKKMFEVASESLEKFVEDLLFSLVFSDTLGKFREKLVESLSPGGDGSVADDYRWLAEQSEKKRKEYTAYLDEVKKEASKQGLSPWSKSDGIDKSLTGATKGVTEETAGIVAGQLNAMRINQVEAAAILRQQLATLHVIAQNTSYNRFLADIHRELKAINASGVDPLRSQGLV